MRILFLGKKGHCQAESAAHFLSRIYPETNIVWGDRDFSFDAATLEWSGDLLLSYIFPKVVPQNLLERASIAAINFHPGPPEYPGIGCTNFALYNEEKSFGVTCHHMLSKVDSGGIISVERFPLYASDSVYSLTMRCYAYIDILFYKTMDQFIVNESFPKCDEQWKRQPYTRKELDRLCEITQDMDETEIARKIRATTFPGMPGPFIRIGGKVFALADDGGKPG